MKCPNCKINRFYELEGSWAQCLNCGRIVCQACAGTGGIDTPFSGSDPSCEECSGKGSFDPDWESKDDPMKLWSGREIG